MNSITRLMIEFTQELGDIWGKELRLGTDSLGQVYDTDTLAREQMYRVLSNWESNINKTNLALKRQGRTELQQELLNLLGITE